MEKCNGWTNRETWLVNLWYGDILSDMAANGEKITPDFIREIIEEDVEDHLHSRGLATGFIRDMMDLGAVNYQELAAHYADEEGEE